MKQTHQSSVIALAIAAVFPLITENATALTDPTSAPFSEKVALVIVKGDRPSSLPTEIPTTIEGIDAKTLATTVNALDAEDALKYFPSLLVRKRYAGDYNHAVLATRASGTGNSARSLVYADGILLSNLLGNGASFTPRWGLVTPEEISRVDVLYGPFSAAYPGNSVGAVVDYVTRMPEKFEAHLKLVGFSENFQQYGPERTYSGTQLSASVGDKQGAFSWWINLNRLDSNGHPLSFSNKLMSAGITSTAGTPVTGAIAGKNPLGLDWWLLAATGQYHTVQDHAKIKLAYDITPTIRASYTFGVWRNQMLSSAESYLHDSFGIPVYSGDINLAGKKYTLSATDIANSTSQPEHLSHGVNLKSHTKKEWDWELAASQYDYRQDLTRTPSLALPAANIGGLGRVSDGKGTGWNTLALKGIWRAIAQHTIEFGYQREAYQLRTQVSDTQNWMLGLPFKPYTAFQGNTQLTSFYMQDAWRINPQWKTILGGRFEQWTANHGAIANANTSLAFDPRKAAYFSPKMAIEFRAHDDLTFKASLGRAVRMPTVSELFQGSISNQIIVNNDPHLKPEKSWTSEWSVEQSLDNSKGLLRATMFHEDTYDALYSQTNTLVTPNISNIQNVEKIRTNGWELAYQGSDVIAQRFDLAASLTHANSMIIKNAPLPTSVGKWQPRVPVWRANLVASFRSNDQWTSSLGLRYSGKQFGTLDNSDEYGANYQGFSRFLVADLRLQYHVNHQWRAAFGIDNLTKQQYWAFHPYSQRTLHLELGFDY